MQDSVRSVPGTEREIQSPALAAFLQERKNTELLTAALWFAVRIKSRKNFDTFKKIAEWLDCYEYILPAKRQCQTAALSFATLQYFKGDLYHTYYALLFVDSILTLKQQEYLTEILQRNLK